MCQTENKTNCTRANAKDLREELHLPCVRSWHKPQAVRDSPCSHRQAPSRKRGKLPAAAISQTLLSLPWMKEGMKHQLPEAAASVWPQQHSIRPPAIKGARDTGKCLTVLKDFYTTLPGNRILCIANKHAKCLSQLVYGLGCCLRVHTHSELLLRKFSAFPALCYFYLNQIYLLLISLVIHCGNVHFIYHPIW